VGGGGHCVVGCLYTSAAGATSAADAGHNAAAGENHANLDAVCATRAFNDAPGDDGKSAGYGGFHKFASSNGHASAFAFADACVACGYAVSHGGGEFPYACTLAYRNAHTPHSHGIACPDAAAPYGDVLPNGHRGTANGYCRAACRHPIANSHGCALYADFVTNAYLSASYGDVTSNTYPSAANAYISAAHGNANATNTYADGV